MIVVISVYYALGEPMTRVPLGPVSLNAAVSIVLSVALVLLGPILIKQRRALSEAFWFLTIWLTFSFLITAVASRWWGPSHASSIQLGLQQLLAWLLFVGSILLGAWMSHHPASYRILPRILIISGCIWGLCVVALRPVEYTVAGFQLVGPRPMAALMLIAFSLSYGKFFCTRHWLPAVAAGVALVALIVSESRSASLAAIVAIVAVEASEIRLLRPRSWTALFRGALTVGAVVAAAWSYSPLRDRVAPLLTDPTFLVSRSSTAAVVTQGRSSAWPALVTHSLEAPIIGHGVGSASAYTYGITQNERFSHPHNEYIRIFHDAGALGLIALLAGFLHSWMIARQLQRDVDQQEVQALAAGVMAMIPAYLVLFLTDNIGFYTFVMVPFGTLIGTASGMRRRPAQQPSPYALSTDLARA